MSKKIPGALYTVWWASTAACITYFCVYAFRKPLSAGIFEGYFLFGLDYKIVLIITQVLGYLTSKFIGIKLISELGSKHRQLTLLLLIGSSLGALLLFALTPYPYNVIWVFFNGLPLGLIWGIVFTYIEGRKITDTLATFLSITFIISSGSMKSIGRTLVEQWHVSEFWMPFFTGCIFLPVIMLSAWMLERIPPPTEEDVNLRSIREPMNGSQRKTLLWTYSVGLTGILCANMLLTIVRDIKDNFLIEIFDSLRISQDVSIYLKTELVVGIVVLGMLSFMSFVKKNSSAFLGIHLLMVLGFALMLCTAQLLTLDLVDPLVLIIIHGIGLYAAYIVFQSLYFERFIATFRVSGNVGFLIYVSDFIGYLASCLILIAKVFYPVAVDWKTFFTTMNMLVSIIGISVVILSYSSFKRKLNRPTVAVNY